MTTKLSIQAAINKDIEPVPQSFKGLCDGPEQLLNFIIQHLSLSVNLINNYIAQEETPKGEEKSLVWIKTSWPYGIGKNIDGEWRVDYSMSGFPANIPFLSVGMETIPQYVKRLSDSEVALYGLPQTVSSSPQRMYWHILTPPELT